MKILARTGLADIILDERGVVKQARHPDPSGRFLARIAPVAKVSHPNVVAVLATGLDGELPYYIMEYVEGPTLAERRGERCADAEAVRICTGIARGLGALHAVGFTHGGLSPEHVFANGVKIGGFDGGQAPWYSAPEQFGEAPLTPAADIYALGCMLFELVTGRAPFEADTAMRLAELHIGSKPPALEEPFDELGAAMLAKDPGARPSIDAILDALAAPRDR